MKTKNYIWNTALAIMLVVTSSFTVSHDAGKVNMNNERTEFANAGYWIDPVVVDGNAAVEKLMAGKGYYIEPVVVKYNAEKAELADKGYYIEPVVVKYNAEKAELADKGYYIEPVVVTAQTVASEQLYAER
jgi:hypothetical protein